jgi:hypothetical protein
VALAYFHCAKYIIRSKLWSPDQEVQNAGRDDLLLAETKVKHGDLSITVDDMNGVIDELNNLY